jgi:hypothetical protein
VIANGGCIVQDAHSANAECATVGTRGHLEQRDTVSRMPPTFSTASTQTGSDSRLQLRNGARGL